MFALRLIVLLLIMGVSSSVYAVKLVSAEIPYTSLENVTDSLSSLGATNIIITDIKSLSLDRPDAPRAYFIHKIKLEVVVQDALLDSVIESIVAADEPRRQNDDEIMVQNIEQVIRIPASD